MKVISPIYSDTRGKLGEAVASKWKRFNVLRSKPLTINDPCTEPQL